jgi:sec-independent protein translocase protein TatA
MGSIGPMELALIAGIALLLFGAGRIASVGKGLGQAIRQFKEGLKDEPAGADRDS